MISIKHTLNIFVFILLITLVINTLIYFIGEETLSNFILNKPIIGPIIAGIIGLIPNCASSVIITKMYLSNVINFATMMSGLLVGAGVGLVVLFKTNKGVKNNIKIMLLLYGIGVGVGILLELIGFSI